MMFVSTTGYIIACIGPFLSDFSNNDASITKNILRHNTDEILDWFEKVNPFPSECTHQASTTFQQEYSIYTYEY